MKTAICVILSALTGIISVSCTSVVMPDSIRISQNDVKSRASNDWDEIAYQHDYRVINNVWNKGAATVPYYQDVVTGEDFFGWNWKWEGRDNVMAYPQVDYGCSPWTPGKKSGTGFPFAAGTRKCTVSFDVEIKASGIYNMTFQIWAVRGSLPEKSAISHEIMIWTIDQSPRQWGWAVHQGKFKYGDVTFDVYTRAHHTDDSGANSNQWRYIAFVPNKYIYKATLNVDEFFDYLIKEKLLTTENYIANIGFGNEVWTSEGYTKIRNYSVTVK